MYYVKIIKRQLNRKFVSSEIDLANNIGEVHEIIDQIESNANNNFIYEYEIRKV